MSRRRRISRRVGATRRSWTALVLYCAVLLVLLGFGTQLSTQASGCLGTFAPPPADEGVEDDAATDEEKTPKTQFRFEPSSR